MRSVTRILAVAVVADFDFRQTVEEIHRLLEPDEAARPIRRS